MSKYRTLFLSLCVTTAGLAPAIAMAQTPPNPPAAPATPTAQTPSLAPFPVAERLSFDDAVQRAMAKNPTVAEAATAILRAEALLQRARAATLPSIGANVSTVTLNQAYGFEGNITQPRNQATFGVGIAVPVLAASQWAAAAQARDQIELAKMSVTDIRRQIAVATGQAYLAVIAEQRQVEVNDRARETANVHLDYARKRLESGAGSQLNQLRAAQEVTTDEARLENARLGLLSAQEALGVLVASAGPVDAAGEPTFDAPPLPDQAAWLSSRTDVQLFMARQKAAEHVLRDSSKDWYPTVTASFDPQYITPAGLFQPSKTWRFTVSLSQPIFDAGLRRSLSRERESLVEQSVQALAGLELQARSDVRLAQESVQSYERAFASSRLSSQQAADVLRITTVAFEAGATTNLEVIDAQRQARDAETTAALAEDAVRKARLELLVALGRFPK